MLIVEGPDCIGKTTLVNALIKRLGELNGGKEPGTDHFGLEDSALDTVDGYAPRIKPWTVSDRGWLSEVVYGEVLRGKSNVNPNMRYILDGMQAAAGGFTVLVWARKYLYERLLGKHWSKEEIFSQPDLMKVADRFQKMGDFPTAQEMHNLNFLPVYEDKNDKLLYPTTDRKDNEPNPVDVIAGRYLQLYCELGAPGAK